jgi:hypothetical protein
MIWTVRDLRALERGVGVRFKGKERHATANGAFAPSCAPTRADFGLYILKKFETEWLLKHGELIGKQVAR